MIVLFIKNIIHIKYILYLPQFYFLESINKNEESIEVDPSLFSKFIFIIGHIALQ